MSRNIHMASYPENCNRKKVQAEWDEYAAMEDWQEGCGGLGADIRWLENIPICENSEEAEKKIQKLDSGWYDQLAVRYYTNEPIKNTKSIDKAKEAYKNAKEAEQMLRIKINRAFLNRKSDFVGCKGCGSKIRLSYLRGPVCPVCAGNLLSDTDNSRLENAKQRVITADRK